MKKVKILVGEEVWPFNYANSWSDEHEIEFSDFSTKSAAIDFIKSFGVTSFIRERTTPQAVATRKPTTVFGLEVRDYVYVDEDRATEFLLKWKWKNLQGTVTN